MATYIAESDTHAGWSSTGKYFGYFGLAAGAVGLTGWAAMHGHLPVLRPADAGDQLLIAAMAWIGGGVFAIMAVAALGSLLLSSKARGTVTVDGVGVLRQIGRRSRMLRWEEIEGFVVNVYGGVTLIPCTRRGSIEIPQSLDDYRGCIAEIKAQGVVSLPRSRMSQECELQPQKREWWRPILTYAGILTFLLAYNSRASHVARIVGLAASTGYLVWVLTIEDRELKNQGWAQWIGGTAALVAIVGWLVYHMVHTW